MRRVHLYVDGYNFYYAAVRGNERNEFPLGLAWCDFRKLAERFMLRHAEQLDAIKYFSAKVHEGTPMKRAGEDRRQAVWLAAVAAIPGLTTIYGFHQKDRSKLRAEKQTDVNIAVELLVDAGRRSCSRAILISGDIDLEPAVRAARERLPSELRLEVDLWVPPGSQSGRWRAAAADLGMNCHEITPQMLVESRLPDKVVTPSGAVIESLPEWRLPAGLAGLKWRIDSRS